MKSFFKNVLSTVVGLFIVGGISCFFLFIIVFAMLGSSSEEYNLKKDTVFSLRLEGVLLDRVIETNPLLEMFNIKETSDLGLDNILSSIKKAKENDDIKGIYINAGMFSASSASLLEIRNQLLDFKQSGKFVVAYADNYTQGCYFVSSVADKVIMNPQGTLDLHGISASPMFYKGLFDKLGIEMQIFKVGTYKSAVEPYMTDKMSPANKEQVGSFANDIWATVLDGIAASRNVTTDKLNAITDTLPMLRNPQMLVDAGLVDTLMYQVDVVNYVKTLVGKQANDDLELASVSNLTTVPFLKKNKADDKIAVLYAEGSIMSGSTNANISDRYYIRELERLRKDDDVKAVVLRVNSPGGSAYASEQIWKAVSDLKAVKPVVVSMGDYAASGGYYIACNASKIIAQPTTLTGSIGIFGMFPNIEGLTQKIGVTFDNVKTNKFSDFGDITRPMNADEKVILQSYIERGYDLFLTRCAEGRGMPKDSLALIAEGRVWTGKQALAIGLVDALGGIDDAVKEAAKLANIKEYGLSSYPRKVDFFERLLSTKKDDFATQAMKDYLGSDYQLLKTIKEIKEQDYIQARLPYDFQLK